MYREGNTDVVELVRWYREQNSHVVEVERWYREHETYVHSRGGKVVCTGRGKRTSLGWQASIGSNPKKTL